jgi:L-iditol 2-dehydrogenase
MKDYRAALIYGYQQIKVEKLELPAVSENDVLVQIEMATMCPTDVKKFKNKELSLPGPLILGHECTGIVAKIGSKVTSVKEGDKVAISPNLPCGKCHFCKKGLTFACEKLLGIGCSVGSIEMCYDLFKQKGIGGAFSEYLKVPERNVWKIPKNVSPEEATLAEPLADVIHSIMRSKVQPGDKVVVIGAGPMGLLHILLLNLLPVGAIIAVEPLEERQKVARKFGATYVVNPETENPVQRVRELLNGAGADTVTVTVGGGNQAKCVTEGISMLATCGTLNVFASAYPPSSIQIDPNLIHYKSLNLIGTVGYADEHFLRALQLLSRGLKEIKDLIYPVVSLDEIDTAFKVYGSPHALKVAIKP